MNLTTALGWTLLHFLWQGAAVADHASAYTQEDQQHEGHRPRDDPGGRQGEESEGA